MKAKFIFLAGLTTIILITTSFAQSRDSIYVNAKTKDTVINGSSAHPFETIRQALDQRQANGLAGMITNEVIIVAPGNYYPTGKDMIILNRYNCGNNGKWLTIQSQIPFAATIHGDSLYTTKFAAIVGFTDSASYVKLWNFTIEHIRNNPDSTQWLNTDGTYTATHPTVISYSNGIADLTTYGDTIYLCRKDVKYGIQLSSDCRYINIFDNDISDISWTNLVDPLKPDSLLTEAEKKILRNAWGADNAGIINALGSEPYAMTNITIDGNEVHHCTPGWTEAITMNGYLDTFNVVNNLVHDIKNIGIVAAGNYGWVLNPNNGFHTPANQNYSRNGTISDNIVYNCYSPIATSAGIYLDGSRNVLVERNQVYNGHVGISVGNENSSSHSGGHTIRNNIVYNNTYTGILLGTQADSAWVENVKVLNNTFYLNNTQVPTILPLKYANGLIVMQNGIAVPQTYGPGGTIIIHRVSNSTDAPGAKIVFQNNIVRTINGILITASDTFRTNSYTSSGLDKSNINTLLNFNYNLYYPQPGANINYNFDGTGFVGNTYNFANYQNVVGLDSASKAIELYTAPSPDTVFVGGASFPGMFALRQNSPAINMGNPSSPNSGTDDFIYHNRILGGCIDAGALEFVVNHYSSNVKSAQIIEKAANTYFVYPNPVVNNLNVVTTRQSVGSGSIELWDISGKLVAKKMVQLQSGVNTIHINNIKGANMVSGNYLLKISTLTESKAFKIIIE